MNRSYNTKTAADSSLSTVAVSKNSSSLMMSSCCNQPVGLDDCRQFSVDELLSDVHRCPLSCLVQLDNSNVVATSLARFQCSACRKSYSTVGGLSKHREFHCRALSASRGNYSQHWTSGSVVSSSTSKDQRCPQCDKAYTSASALKMHIRTHTLPCRCRLCGKAFSRPWLLQGHVRTHTGEKPFTCPHCQRAFADRSNLRAHLQTHYDVKQYRCDVCRRTFSRMSLLLKHRYGACAVGSHTTTGIGTTGFQQKPKNTP